MKQLVVLSIICLFVGVLFPSCNAFSNPNGYREEYYFDYFDTVSHIYDYSDDADSDFEHRSKIFEKTMVILPCMAKNRGISYGNQIYKSKSVKRKA